MSQAVRFAIIAGIAALLVGGGIFYKIKRNAPQPPDTSFVIIPQEQPTIRITDPQRGPATAPLTIVYFSDFGCDSCAGADQILAALEQEFGAKIRFVWKDFPNHKNIYPESYELHKAGRCAATMGKFWEFQRIAFLHTSELRLQQPVLDKVLMETNLDGDAIKKCMALTGISAAIRDNEREAKALSVTATPTFFIDGIRYEGAMPYYQFAGTIRKILAKIEYDSK